MKGVFLFHGHWLIIHRVGWPSCWIQQPVHPSWWLMSQCPWFTNLWKCSWVDRSTVYSVPLPTWKIISRVLGLLFCCSFCLVIPMVSLRYHQACNIRTEQAVWYENLLLQYFVSINPRRSFSFGGDFSKLSVLYLISPAYSDDQKCQPL